MKRVLLLLYLLTLALPLHPPARAIGSIAVYVEPQAGVTPLVQFIQQARRSLDGEVYELTSRQVETALESAAHRGVNVRIALEEHPEGASRSIPVGAYKALAAGGVHVEWTSRTFTFTHAKYLVRDDQAAWIGSPNWTLSAFKSNREFAVVDTDSAVVSEAEAVFTADWAHHSYTGSAADLVLSPVNSRSKITALITGAHSTLDVYAEELNDVAQEDALIAAVHRGVRVRVVCTGDGDVAKLTAGGVQVVIDKKLYIHAKAIVMDGRVVFIGSENISATSLDKNREMGLILADPVVISAVEQAFASDFECSRYVYCDTLTGTGHAATPTPVASSSPASSFMVRATVTPNPMSYDSAATLTVTTTPGATCSAHVVYSTGSVPSSFHGSSQVVPAAASVFWSWHESTKGSGGTATVSCTLGRKSASTTVTFTVTH